MSTLERAIAIATRAHAGQVDKAGAPYIMHPMRVMLRCTDPDARIVAVLHDVVEDTPITPAQLRGWGFSEAILTALEHVTKREVEGYLDFVRRAVQDPIAREVKRADLIDNLDITRIPHPTTKDHARLERYREALRLIDSA